MAWPGGGARDHGLTIELLESTHRFPGMYPFKVIGEARDDFASRVVAVAVRELGSEHAVSYRERRTSAGRHVSVSLELNVQSAEQVLSIYASLIKLEGLVLLL